VKTENNIPILDEITEELKRDQQWAFINKHWKVIISIVVAIAVGILGYSSWRARGQRQRETITSALFDLITSQNTKNDLLFAKLLDEAPAELKPILTIMRSGRKMLTGDFAQETLKPLLDLSTRHGIDLVWKDLALLIYGSYPTKEPTELIKLLSPLMADDRPFRFTVMELVAMLHDKQKNRDEAEKLLQKIIDHKDAPESQKKRARMLIGYIKNQPKS
jgi:hypothetical protein